MLTADDLTVGRKKESLSPRDHVVLGLRETGQFWNIEETCPALSAMRAIELRGMREQAHPSKKSAWTEQEMRVLVPKVLRDRQRGASHHRS